MSLFQCIDRLDAILMAIDENERSSWYLFGKGKAQLIEETAHEKTLALSLKSCLQAREHTDNYDHFTTELKLIDAYRRQINKELPPYLKSIKDDLNQMRLMAAKKRDSPKATTSANFDAKQVKDAKIRMSLDENYRKFQKSPYLIATLRQGKDHRLGLSRGECYGFTFAMVDPELSLYKKPHTALHLNRKIHEYQKFQMDRDHDQDHIKRKRLTREYFCPDPQKQVMEIYAIAKKNQGKELGLMRRASVGSHASYLCVEPIGNIRYMDPNHGVYLFKTKEEFCEFYLTASKIDKQQGVQFKFYNIDELRDDQHHQLEESISWSGKIRSLLTGNKYNDNTQISQGVTSTTYSLFGGGIGAGIGAIMGSITPIVGTIFGAILGCFIGAIAGYTLNWFAVKNGHMGLLGVPHYLQERWYSYTEHSSEIEPQLKHANAIKNLSCSSTVGMLCSMHCNVTVGAEPTPARASPIEIDRKSPVPLERSRALDASSDAAATLQPHAILHLTTILQSF